METLDLLSSVKAWFNQPCEVDLRVQKQGTGLSEPERRMIRFLPQKSRILDIGCATGRVSSALAKEGHIVTGIDVAEQLVEKARTLAKKQGVPVTYQTCDPVVLPFPDDTFNAVLFLHTYCYVPKRQTRIKWLREIARVLKPDGWLFLSQHIIDQVMDSYEPIREDNQQRFPAICATLEEGDGFSLPAEGSETATYIHFFLETDLRAELDDSPFQLVDSFCEEDRFYGSIKKK